MWYKISLHNIDSGNVIKKGVFEKMDDTLDFINDGIVKFYPNHTPISKSMFKIFSGGKANENYAERYPHSPTLDFMEKFITLEKERKYVIFKKERDDDFLND